MTYVSIVNRGSISEFTQADNEANLSITDSSSPQGRLCEVRFPEGSHAGGSLSLDFRELHDAAPKSMFAWY